MHRLTQVVISVAAVLAACATVRAQRRAETIVASAPSGTQVIRTGPAQSTAIFTNPGTIQVNGVPFSAGDVVAGIISPLPSFGFDFTHVAAVNRDLGVRALIDPVTQHQLALAGRLRAQQPFITPIVTFPVVVNNIQVNVTPQPPVVILQSVHGEDDSEDRGRASRQTREPEVVPAPQIAPPAMPQAPRELNEFVLLRLDGQLIFAVGYSVARERITFVTREGIRRSFPLAELDTEATLRLNEQRGTLIQIPGA